MRKITVLLSLQLLLLSVASAQNIEVLKGDPITAATSSTEFYKEIGLDKNMYHSGSFTFWDEDKLLFSQEIDGSFYLVVEYKKELKTSVGLLVFDENLNIKKAYDLNALLEGYDKVDYGDCIFFGDELRFFYSARKDKNQENIGVYEVDFNLDSESFSKEVLRSQYKRDNNYEKLKVEKSENEQFLSLTFNTLISFDKYELGVLMYDNQMNLIYDKSKVEGDFEGKAEIEDVFVTNEGQTFLFFTENGTEVKTRTSYHNGHDYCGYFKLNDSGELTIKKIEYDNELFMYISPVVSEDGLEIFVSHFSRTNKNRIYIELLDPETLKKNFSHQFDPKWVEPGFKTGFKGTVDLPKAVIKPTNGSNHFYQIRKKKSLNDGQFLIIEKVNHKRIITNEHVNVTSDGQHQENGDLLFIYANKAGEVQKKQKVEKYCDIQSPGGIQVIEKEGQILIFHYGFLEEDKDITEVKTFGPKIETPMFLTTFDPETAKIVHQKIANYQLGDDSFKQQIYLSNAFVSTNYLITLGIYKDEDRLIKINF